MRQNALDFSSTDEHFNLLHNESRGTVIVWEKFVAKNKFVKLQPGDPSIPQILSAQTGQDDRYLTVNEFYGWRRVRFLKSLRAFFVDLDGIQDMSVVLEALSSTGLPVPSVAVFSGRGIHLYWLIEPIPAKTLPTWQLVENRIVQSLAEAIGRADSATNTGGVDFACRDCARFLRLVGSVNSKNGAVVRGLTMSGKYWKLHELADVVLGKRPNLQVAKHTAQIRSLDAKRAETGQKKQQAIYSAKSIGSWWYKVYQDCYAIADCHRSGIPEGYRNKLLFIISNSLAWFAAPDVLEDEITSLARRLTPTLNQVEAVQAMQTIIDRAYDSANGKKIQFAGFERDSRYFFRRETLLEWLQPIIPVEIACNLRAIVSDEILKQHKKETDRKFYEKKKGKLSDHYTGGGCRQSNEQKRATARLMKAGGCSFRKIAEELLVSVATVYKWCSD